MDLTFPDRQIVTHELTFHFSFKNQNIFYNLRCFALHFKHRNWFAMRRIATHSEVKQMCGCIRFCAHVFLVGFGHKNLYSFFNFSGEIQLVQNINLYSRKTTAFFCTTWICKEQARPHRTFVVIFVLLLYIFG